MDLEQFMREYAKEIGGQFSNYDHQKSIIVIPLGQGRYQTIIGNIKQSPSQMTLLELSSKICKFTPNLDISELLHENAHLSFARFLIREGYVRVQATTCASTTSPELIKEMILEVADAADLWEQRLTGIDVH